MPDRQKEQLLVNLRPHVVEVHLPDRVITVGPMGSATVAEVSPQVTELARRGLVQLRDAGDDLDPDGGTDDGADETEETDEDPADDQPPTRKARRTRGPAAAKSGQE